MEQKKELKQVVERIIGGVKFKYNQAYHLDYNNKGKNVTRFSSKQVKQNLEACQKAYLKAIE